MSILSYLILFLIKAIRPLLGPSNCRYAIGCTAYAQEQFTTQPFLIAFKKSTVRVLSCNPFTT